MPGTAAPVKKRTIKRKKARKKATSTRVDDAHETNDGQATKLIAFELPIDRIAVVENDRTEFDPEKLKHLSASIQQRGVLEPLVVAPGTSGSGTEGHVTVHRLIAGERRLRAAKLAGLSTVPVVVRDFGLTDMAVARLEENLQREDLNPVEKAGAVKRLMDDHGLKQKEIAKILGCTQAQVSNMIGVLELPEVWQQWVAAGKLAATAVRPLRPYAKKRPQVLQRLVDDFCAEIDEGGYELTQGDINGAISSCTRSLSLAHFSEWSPPRKDDCHFKYDAKKHSDLDVEEMQISWRKEKRAWNVERFDELNARNLQKRRKAHSEFKAKQKADDESRAGKSPNKKKRADEPEPWTKEPHQFETLITRQLLRMFADRLPGKDKHGQQLLLTYIASTEVACKLWDAANELLSLKCSHPQLMRELSTHDAKKWPGFLHDLLTKTLHKQTENWFCEGLDMPDLIVDAAQMFFDLDLMASWQPDRELLELCSDDWLRDAGEKSLKLQSDEQPRDRDGLLSWLEVDWPEGFLPEEVRDLVTRK